MVKRERLNEALSKLLISPLLEAPVISCTVLLTFAVYPGVICGPASDNFSTNVCVGQMLFGKCERRFAQKLIAAATQHMMLISLNETMFREANDGIMGDLAIPVFS